jgi:nucleotide-binding universal stress UspA family protein
MIKHLLVPLDGSILAESVLPTAASLAKKINTEITFIHIIEKDAPQQVHGQSHLTSPEQAAEYLKSIADMEIFKGLSISAHVHEEGEKNIPLSIAQHSKELNQDLVVMCTHGSSGLHGMLFGSIAQQVIALGKIPVLLINPSKEKIKSVSRFNNFLIPLDGNPDHEQALDFASGLAKICKANIHLLVAIPHFGNMSGGFTQTNRLLPGTTTQMMDMIVSDAEEYLGKLRKELEQKGIKATTQASRDNPANAIIKAAKDINADLIILATHGTKGAEALLEGSITPKISKSSKIPLLLVPVTM